MLKKIIIKKWVIWNPKVHKGLNIYFIRFILSIHSYHVILKRVFRIKDISQMIKWIKDGWYHKDVYVHEIYDTWAYWLLSWLKCDLYS